MTERPVSVVPSLDAIAQHPELVQELPPHVCRALTIKAGAVVTMLATRLESTDATPERTQAAAADELLTAGQAAALLGISPLTIIRRRHRRPYSDFVVPIGTRLIRFSSARIQAYISESAGSVSVPRRPARRNGASGARAGQPSTPTSAAPGGGV